VRITADTLPPYESISCEPLREAAAALDAAKAAQSEARRAVVHLEQTRDAAEWRDAEAAERARAEGKAEPKRTYVAQHDKALDAARHELKVAELGTRRARDELDLAVEAHAATWAADVAQDAATLCEQWDRTTGELSDLYGRLSSTLALARRVVGAQPNYRAVRFPARQIHELDIAPEQRDPHGVVTTEDVLAALAGLPLAPAAPPAPQEHRAPVNRSPLLDHADVQAEIDERRAFDASVGSPE
jgi:hypothetical protein